MHSGYGNHTRMNIYSVSSYNRYFYTSFKTNVPVSPTYPLDVAEYKDEEDPEEDSNDSGANQNYYLNISPVIRS